MYKSFKFDFKHQPNNEWLTRHSIVQHDSDYDYWIPEGWLGLVEEMAERIDTLIRGANYVEPRAMSQDELVEKISALNIDSDASLQKYVSNQTEKLIREYKGLIDWDAFPRVSSITSESIYLQILYHDPKNAQPEIIKGIQQIMTDVCDRSRNICMACGQPGESRHKMRFLRDPLFAVTCERHSDIFMSPPKGS